MKQTIIHPTPKDLGYRFPAEWEPHNATWLSYPHDDSYSWPGTLDGIFDSYNKFIKEISKGEVVRINVRDEWLKAKVEQKLGLIGVDLAKVEIFIHPTNDAWARDHGPAFLVNPQSKDPKVIVSWKYNAWGNKYPFELDEKIPGLVAKALQIPVYYPGIVMEGGSVEFNGRGTVMTTTSCLLNENRNPGYSQDELEEYLRNYYGVEQVLWLDHEVAGDDTNGHIDDHTRFFNEDSVVTAVEGNAGDANYKMLKSNLEMLKKMRLLNGKQLNIAEIPMPRPVWFDGQRLPASYANFYITNHSLIVPVYRCKEDDKAMAILEECFPDRQITGIDSLDIIWGMGSFHCLSQQEPLTHTTPKLTP
jgi:agmatine deiminase